VEAPGLKHQETEGAFSAYWSTSYFPALDGLRAVCIAMVMSYHLHEKVPSFFYGELGVDVFFVLSGFLITTLLLREKERSGSVSLKGFYVRRAFRILPVYYLVLLLYFPAVWLMHDSARWHELKGALPYLLTFTQEFRPVWTGNVYAQTWSLGFEEKFYLLWPLLVLALYPFRRRGFFILLALGTGICFLPWLASRSYTGLLLGSLLGILLDRSTQNRLQLYLAKIDPWFALGMVVVAYLLVGAGKVPVHFFSAAVVFLVAALVLRQGILRRILAHPLMVVPGKRSYAMYLVHVLVINAATVVAKKARVDVWFVVLPLAYLSTFLVATLLFYLVEGPSIEYGRRISRRMRSRLTESLAIPVPAEAAQIRSIENPVDV
jgi:peptidoglycan/LPS O-acetylase OafA/YrhL